MSSLVYFKFKANVKTESIPFDGSSISVKDLKNAIRTKCCLYSSDFDLKLEDSNGKAYVKDEELIPKYTSIVVRRVPRLTTDLPRKKLPAPEDIAWRDGPKNTPPGMHQQKHVNLADSDLSEEEKIKIMMERSSESYSEKNYSVKAKPYGVPPAAYICHKCGLPGHWIHNCPGIRDKTGKIMDVKSIKRPTGIPQDFLLEVDAGTPGAYLGKSGKYMVPIKDAEAYAQGKKDKRPFSVEENPPYIPTERTPPKQFICPLCSEMFRDAVLVSCCGTTYCNDCIMGHVFDSQILGSHKCPNCDAVLTDHESSVFENALVRSMIRDWLANEIMPEPDVSTQQDVFKLDTVLKTLNNRRVLKPKHGLGSSNRSAESQPCTDASGSNSNELHAAERRAVPSPHTDEISPTDSQPIPTSAPVLPTDSKETVELVINNSISSVVTSNTCTAAVASAPSTTLGSGKLLLPVTSSVSSSQFPRISYPVSTSIAPTILSSIAGVTNPLLSAFYNMRVENLQVPVTTQQVVLPVPFQGSVVGGTEWSAGTVLSASVPQAAGLVDTLLHVNNQNPYGIVPGQALSGSLSTPFPPIRDLDGHKVLSKEEFYRLKMEMLHSARRRHRHRSRSAGRVSRRSANAESDFNVWRHERRSWERRLPHRSPCDRESDYGHRKRYDPDDRYLLRRDRDRSYYCRRRTDDPAKLDSDSEGYYHRERRRKDRYAKPPEKTADSVRPRVRSRYDSRSESLSPGRGGSIERVHNSGDSGASREQDFRNRSASPHSVSIVPQYDVSESESTESKGRSVQKEPSVPLKHHDARAMGSPTDPVTVTCRMGSPWEDSNFENMNSQGVEKVDHEISEQPKKRSRKDKKHKKHKHKRHSDKKKSDNLAESETVDLESASWLTDLKTNSYEEAMSSVIDELTRKTRKHKKHKHGSKDKKKERKHRSTLSPGNTPMIF